jgi:hypothetical protein
MLEFLGYVLFTAVLFVGLRILMSGLADKNARSRPPDKGN